MTISTDYNHLVSWLFPQKNYVLPEQRAKREVGPVNLNVLTDEQKKAFDEIIEFLDAPREERLFHNLVGYAGTGKTFLISRLEEWLIHNRRYSIMVTAPTNKAVKILRDMADVKSDSLSFRTLHSLLKMKMEIDGGEKVFVKQKSLFDDEGKIVELLSDYDLLIVDEVSMVNIQLFTELYKELGMPGCSCKVLFVGDPAQIPPVNFNECVPFQKSFRIKYGIEESKLQVIQRQAKGNPIIEYSFFIRDRIHEQVDNFDYREMYTEQSGGIIPILKAHQSTLYEVCKNYYDTDLYLNYPDFIKIIAYRNATVNAANRKIRSFIYKDKADEFILEGELLVVNEPIVKVKIGRGSRITKDVLYKVNDELRVLKTSVKETGLPLKFPDGPVVHPDFRIKYYECEVQELYGTAKNIISVVHPDSRSAYNSLLESLVLRIHSMRNYDMQRAGWRTFYNVKELFSNVSYNYAITAHKSQGSTYENVVMLNWDMMENTRYEERNRIRYVAASRAKSRLFIIV